MFVDSPYFNTNPKIVRLVEYLCRHHPRFDAPDFTERNAYAHLLGASPYKTGVVTKLSSKLFKLLARFFVAEGAGRADFGQDFALLLEYRRRGLLDDFDRLARNLRKRQQAGKGIKPELFHERFLLEREINRVASTRQDKGVGDVNFGAASAALDSYYIYHKLIYTCQKINRGLVVKGFEGDDPLAHVLQSLPDVGYGTETAIKIWHEAYLLLSSEDKQLHYNQLKTNVMTDKPLLDGAQVRILFTYLENTAIRIIRSKEALYGELFDLYEYQRNIGVFLHKDVAVSEVMSNYITVATYLGKIGQARVFLEMVREQLDAKRDEVFKFCDAKVLFEEGDYSATLDRLNDLQFRNLLMKLGEKRLRLKVYHQLGYEGLLYDNMNSFRVFLTNNKDSIADRHLQANRRFVTHLRRVADLGLLPPPERHQLQADIQADSVSSEREWLLKQF